MKTCILMSGALAFAGLSFPAHADSNVANCDVELVNSGANSYLVSEGGAEYITPDTQLGPHGELMVYVEIDTGDDGYMPATISAYRLYVLGEDGHYSDVGALDFRSDRFDGPNVEVSANNVCEWEYGPLGMAPEISGRNPHASE